MSFERLREIERLFQRALELAPEKRQAFLDDACADDDEVRREVESLLQADARSGGFLEQPVVEHGFEFPIQSAQAPSTGSVGHYRLLRRTGEGGMSEVYLAVRADDEYQKRVALKIIRQDLDREDMLRRFRTERQILAGLDHPNIAKLLDGGTTDQGLPYFVMDFIEGTPIEEYCDRNRLTLRERIDLFRSVCSAVQYAHQNLIVHRDIKASNILVTAEGVPKLLDFGIAKLLKPDQFTEQVEYTETWLRPMTPRYASPEQVQGQPVTTASDVYSLGVLLYKLMTGHLPYRLEGRQATELARLVVEEEPERPSTAITRVETDPANGERAEPSSPAVVGAARRCQPQQLRRQLSGDLDNIVLMALRKEPRRRYGSVEQFAEDLGRYLSGRPVLARKDTLGYRATKFLRRNWVGVGVAAAFLALLVGFAVTMAFQANRIARERDEARRERDRSASVVHFLEEIFEVPDPLEAEGENITAREILDRGARRVSQELADQPEVQATLLDSIGNVYRNLGLYDRSLPLLQQALETRRDALGKDPAVADTLLHLGVLHRLTGDFDTAQTLLSEGIELHRELSGPSHPSVAMGLNHLGIVHRQKSDYEAAERLYLEAIAICEADPVDRRELATSKNNLAALKLDMGDFEAAEVLFRESLALKRELYAPRHPIIAQNLSNLGVTLGIQGKYDEAEPPLREALTIYRDVLMEGHPTLVEGLNNLAKLLTRQRDLDGAESLYREALEIQRKRVGQRDPRMGFLMSNLAELLQQKGDLDGAEQLYREALSLRREVMGRHPDTAGSLINLGKLLIERGRAAAAEPLVREGLEICSEKLPEGHWRIADARSVLGACLAALDRYDEAEPHIVEGYDELNAKLGPDHRRSRLALERVIDLYDVWNRPEKTAEYRLKLAD